MSQNTEIGLQLAPVLYVMFFSVIALACALSLAFDPWFRRWVNRRQKRAPKTAAQHDANYHPIEGVDYIERWVGFHLESKGRLSASFWDHNPGSLSHVYLFRVPVPEEVRHHFLQKRECLVLDKFGNAQGHCDRTPITTTEPSQKEEQP